MQYLPCFRTPGWRLALAASACIAAGCGGEDKVREITEVHEVRMTEASKPPKLSTRERLRLAGPGAIPAQPQGAPPGTDMEATQPHPNEYNWDTPEGWVEQPPTRMRLANFTLEGMPEAECYFTVLGGTGGGLAANVNRWRRQMGLAPYTPEELEALPRKPLLGEPAVFVTMDGAYAGMRGGPGKEGYRLLGLARAGGGKAYFVKMVGPQEALETQEDEFLAFAASLRPAEAGEATGLPAGHPPVDAGATPEASEAAPEKTAAAPEAPPAAPEDTAGAFDPSRLRWDAPEGWERGADRPMRLATYNVGEAECYITVLGGAAGGVAANINRWRRQMGAPPLSEEALADLPRVEVLGEPAPLVQVEGDFTGMRGTTIPGAMLLGVVRGLETHSLFVKMIGPAETVSGEVAAFKAFCRSLRLE